MQFTLVSALALVGVAAAQNVAEVGMICINLYGPGQNPAKKDPTDFYIIDPVVCNTAGGTLYMNDIVCCPKGNDTNKDIVPYINACDMQRGSYHWPYEYTGTKWEVVPPGWKCPGN